MFDDVVDELRKSLTSAPIVYKGAPIAKHHATSTKSLVAPGHAEIACLMLSDLHIAEVVRAQDVNGMGTYNSLVAANRLHEVIDNAKKIIRLHQSMYKIDKIWVPLLGDMISGSIHPELASTNDLSDPAATVLAARLLSMALLELETLGLPIQVSAHVGNHPRTTVTMPTKRKAESNYDWLCYEMLASMLSDHPNIDIQINTGQISIVEQYGWRFVLEHGYGNKHNKEEETEDRIRAIFDDPQYRDIARQCGTTFHCVLIGDQHKPKFLANTIVNGALTGWSELATAWRLRPVRACQQLFGISKGHMRTWAYSIDVTDIRSQKAENPFSEYTKEFLSLHKA